jgi:hypothetical protein
MECTDPDDILNNLVNIMITNTTGSLLNDMIIFDCAPGYKHVSGDLVWFCVGDVLQWHGTSPTCEGIQLDSNYINYIRFAFLVK